MTCPRCGKAEIDTRGRKCEPLQDEAGRTSCGWCGGAYRMGPGGTVLGRMHEQDCPVLAAHVADPGVLARDVTLR